VTNDIGLFSRYLTFPDTVPDYRQKREHAEFCTTLLQAGYAVEVREIVRRLSELVREKLSGLELV
jgi:hypothetical protein